VNQKASNALRNFVRTIVLASLMALTVAIPNPISGSAQAAVVAPDFTSYPGKVHSSGLYVWFIGVNSGELNTAVFPDFSTFTVTSNGTRIAVKNMQYQTDQIFTLVLAYPIPKDAKVNFRYDAPDFDDVSKTNKAIQFIGGVDARTFAFSSILNESTYVPSAPKAPGAATVVVGEESATVKVTPPTTGDAPTSYTVTALPGGKTCTVEGPSGSCTITGLAAGISYTFTTVATNALGSSTAGAASAAVTVLAKSSTGDSSSGTGGTTDTTGLNTASWDVEPATDSESDSNTVGFFPNPVPGNSIITNEFGFVIDKKGGIKPKIRMKNYSGRIAMTITAKYKVAGKNKNYKCTFKPFGTTKKVKSVKWRWYTPKKACILPKPLIAAVQKGETKISAKGKWSRQWLTSGKKARPNKSKIKPRTLKYTMRAKPAVVK